MGKHKGGKKAGQPQQPQQPVAPDAAQVVSPAEAAAPAAEQDPVTHLQELAQQRKEVADKLRLTERQVCARCEVVHCSDVRMQHDINAMGWLPEDVDGTCGQQS